MSAGVVPQRTTGFFLDREGLHLYLCSGTARENRYGEGIFMLYSEARQGRTFIIRLEDGDILHEEIERFARQRAIQAAALIVVGGAGKGSRLVVGPEDGRAEPVVPMECALEDVHEVAGTGTLFPDEKGNPVLHMHIACGREQSTITGCVRKGVKVWHIMEVILIELADSAARRVFDPDKGFNLLKP
jgi:predicted DNA-binding protein with PD1-like motif